MNGLFKSRTPYLIAGVGVFFAGRLVGRSIGSPPDRSAASASEAATPAAPRPLSQESESREPATEREDEDKSQGESARRSSPVS